MSKMDKINRLLIGIIVLMAIMPLASASITSSDYGIFKQDNCIKLIQVCDNCTFVNITSIQYPNSTDALINVEMTKAGTLYNYSFCDTNNLGRYIVTGFGDLNGDTAAWNYNFIVTKTGADYSTFSFLPLIISLIGVVAILLALAFALAENHGIISALFAGIAFYLLIPLLNVSALAFENNFIDPGISGMISTITQIFTWLDYALIVYICIYIMVQTISGYNQDKQERIEGLK
jgi:hypothetical protein